MSENLDPIKQVIQIDVNETGTSEATEKVQGLNKSINNTVIENKKSEDSFKSLKVQLREAIVEQQKLADKFGATSQQAIKAAKAVAGIKDEIGLQKDLVDSFNPDDKFRALTQTAGVAALALGGVKDGFTALGIESEVLDKVIGSAQAILGVTSAVAGMSDAYAVLTASKRAKSAADVVEIGTTEALAVANTEATVTTWSWNAALLANPIVLITAGIVAAGAAIYAYIKITGDAVKAEEKAKVASMQLDQAIEHQSKTFEKNSDSNSRNNDFKIALLKASGASEAQILRETKALKEQEIQMGINASAEAYRLLLKAQQLNSDNPTDFTEKSLQSAKENYKRMQDFVDNSFNDLEDIRNNAEVAKVQAETDARLKREEAEKKEIEDRKERQKKEFEDQLKKKQEDQKALNEFQINTFKAKLNQDLVDAELQAENLKTITDQVDAIETERVEKSKRLKEQEVEAEKLKNEAIATSKENLNRVSNGLQDSGIAKTKAGQVVSKGIALTQIGIDSAVALSKASTLANAEGVAAQTALPFVPGIGTVARVLSYTGTTLSVVSNIARAKQLLSGGGSGGASAGANGGSQTPQPSRNVAQVGFQASSENQIGNAVANQQRNQPPLQAFVVSQSVRDAEELARKKELVNSF
jgi:hypothetical protein